MSDFEDSVSRADRGAAWFRAELPAERATDLALIVRRALDGTAGDSAFNRRLRALYQRVASRARPADSQGVFLRRLAELLAVGRRDGPQARQDSRVVEDTLIE